jgi:hypothetical protein
MRTRGLTLQRDDVVLVASGCVTLQVLSDVAFNAPSLVVDGPDVLHTTSCGERAPSNLPSHAGLRSASSP